MTYTNLSTARIIAGNVANLSAYKLSSWIVEMFVDYVNCIGKRFVNDICKIYTFRHSLFREQTKRPRPSLLLYYKHISNGCKEVL